MAAPKTRVAAPAGFDRIHRILGTAMRAADPATWPARPHRNGALPVLSSRSQLGLALVLCDITREVSPRVTAFKGNLKAFISGWDNDLYQIASWYRET